MILNFKIYIEKYGICELFPEVIDYQQNVVYLEREIEVIQDRVINFAYFDVTHNKRNLIDYSFKSYNNVRSFMDQQNWCGLVVEGISFDTKEEGFITAFSNDELGTSNPSHYDGYYYIFLPIVIFY